MAKLSLEHNPVSFLGKVVLQPLEEMGQMSVFLFQSLWLAIAPPWQFGKLLVHVHFIGAKSIFVIILTGAFTGMVLGLQGYYSLSRFGSEGVLGAMVSASLIREMGPVLTAFMVVARAGSAIAAELGAMRISEQIDALRTMDINPLKFLISPRLVAALISFPLLTAIFDFVGIMGGYLTGSVLMGQGSGVYFDAVARGADMYDINGGFTKALVFAAIVVTICSFKGFFAHQTPAGFGSKAVGYATTHAVVVSCVAVLAFDYVLTSFMLN